MPEVDINLLAVIVAAVVNMAVGAFWYSPTLFGKQWSRLSGRKLEDMKGDGNTGYAIAGVGALIQGYILAHFVQYTGAVDFVEGLTTGFWLWLGFTGITMAVNNVFSGQPWKLWQIDSGYFFVVLLLNGGLLAVWQ